LFYENQYFKDVFAGSITKYKGDAAFFNGIPFLFYKKKQQGILVNLTRRNTDVFLFFGSQMR
jgi:hypothetical protein